MSTIGDRVEEIQKALGVPERELARRAGLAEPHIGLIKARFREDPNAEINLSTLKKLAAVGGVRLSWLIEGTGPRNAETTTEYVDLYEARIPLLRALRESPDPLAPRVLEELVNGTSFHGAETLTLTQWIEEAADAARRVRKREANQPEPPPDARVVAHVANQTKRRTDALAGTANVPKKRPRSR